MLSADELRQARTAAGLSLAELAERAGVARETLRLIEAEGRSPHARTERQIRAALEMPTNAPAGTEDPRTKLLRLFDQTPAPVQAWLLATAELAAQGFVRAHEATLRPA